VSENIHSFVDVKKITNFFLFMYIISNPLHITHNFYFLYFVFFFFTEFALNYFCVHTVYCVRKAFECYSSVS